jgi:hypothetical protein
MKQFFHFKMLWLALFLGAFFAAPQSAHATHALGADLSYTSLGNNAYRFTLVFYRDCSGIAAPTTFVASVNGCGNAAQSFTLSQVGLATEITPVCATQTSSCSGGTVFGVQRYVYQGVFTFASQCANWKVSTQECCRNLAISTIANPGNFDIYVQAIVNNTIVNNAPVFTQTPALYACVNQPFIYNNVVIDTDGDSLSYALTNPLDGPAPGTSISYGTGFSALEPLSVTAAGFGFNNITGQMSFTPTTVGEVSVLAFLVKEYRNGVFIGSVMRDVQIIVQNCAANNAPTLGNITNVTGATFVASSGSGTFKVCPGQAMSFSISASDIDATQMISMLTNIATEFPGATATVVNAGTNAATLTFTWVPTNADAGAHLFRVETRDDHCPTYASAVKGFVIKVQGVSGVSFIKTLCKGTPTVIDLSAQAYEVAGGQYQWTASPSVGTLPNTQNITTTIAQSTTFTVRYQDNICNATDTVIVSAYGGVVATPVIVNAYCPSSAPIALTATYPNPAPASALACGLGNAAQCTGTPANRTIGTGTTTTGTVNNAGGVGTPYQGFFEDGRLQLLYTAAELTAANVRAGLISALSFDITSKFSTAPYQNFSIKMGCTNDTTFTTAAGFLATGNTVYNNTAGETTTLGTNTYAFQTPYVWDGISNVFIEICYDNAGFAFYDHVAVTPTTNNSVLYRRQDGLVGCTLTGSIVSNQRANIVLSNCAIAAATGSVTYAWTVSPTAAGAVSNAAIANPTATVANAANGTTIRYIVTATDGRCRSKDTVVVNAACAACFNVAVIRTPNTAILTCARPSVPLTAAAPGSNGVLTYLWSNAATTATINATVSGTYTVTVTNTMTNGSTCTSTASVAVTQNNVVPTVTVSSSNNLDCVNTTATLSAFASTNSTFVWSSGAPAVTAPGTYTVTATRVGNGCTATASIVVTQNIVAPVITITKSNDLSCLLTTATLSATSTIGTAFVWSIGAPNVVAPGTYTVTATNIANGCAATKSIAVTQNIAPPAITLTKNHDLNCSFNTALLSATSIPNSSFVWSSGAPTVTAAGTYSVTATRADNGCTAVASIAVTQNTTAAAFTLTKNHDLDCSAVTAVLSANATTGTNTYLWSNAATTATISVTAANTYTVTATNSASNCTASLTIAVTQNITPPTVTATAANMLDCAHASALLTATANILTPTYRWSNGTPTQTTTVTTPNTYRVTVTNPVNNCSSTASVVVTRSTTTATASITGNTALDCTTTSTTLAASANVGGNPTYTWSNGANTPTTLVDNAGIYGVTITSASTSCTAIGSVTVTENATAPTVTISGITSFCSNRSTVLIATTGTTASTFIWNNGNTAAANTVLTTNTYTVTATNPTNHCTASKQITVTTRPAPVAAITQLAVVCPGIPTALIASGGGTYIWNTAVTNPILTIQTPTITTVYTVTVTATNGCSAAADITVQALTGTICVGTENATDNTAGITLFPNPTKDAFSIVFGSSKWTNTTISITDIAGRTIATLQKSLITPNETLAIPTNDWATGVYFVTISNASDKKVMKVVKVMER